MSLALESSRRNPGQASALSPSPWSVPWFTWRPSVSGSRCRAGTSVSGVQSSGVGGHALFRGILPTPSFVVLSDVQVPGQGFM